MITNAELTTLITAYNNNKIGYNELHAVFCKLAEHYLQYKKWQLHDFINETADLCMVKLEKFDVNRGKTFNFFNTIIACYFWQMRRINRGK